MNNELFEKIIAHIQEEPRRLQMATWIHHPSGRQSEIDKAYYPPCNTAGCVAGWAVLLSLGEATSFHDIPARAQRLLGLDDKQADSLFYTYQWPAEFERKYSEGTNKVESAFDMEQSPAAVDLMSEGVRLRMEATVERLRHLMATGE